MQAASRTIWILQELWWSRGKIGLYIYFYIYISMFEINMLTFFFKCSLTKNIYLNKWISVTDSFLSRPFSMWWWGMSCQKVYCLSNWSRVEGDWESSADLVSLCILFNLKFLCSCDHRGRVGVGGLCWFRSLLLLTGPVQVI
jgi:hypothetical protein